MGPTYTKTFLGFILKFTLNWAPCILPGSPTHKYLLSAKQMLRGRGPKQMPRDGSPQLFSLTHGIFFF